MKGSCLCGAVEYEADQLDMPISHCHCRTCRKAHAARPDLFAQLPRLVNESRLDEAREIFYRLLPMMHRAFEEPNPGPVKAALALMKQMRDELRSPMQAASAEMREALRKELKRLDCI